MSALPETATHCGACGAEAETIIVVCRGCGKAICSECVLDDELKTLRCSACLDWTHEGRQLRDAGKPRRRGR